MFRLNNHMSFDSEVREILNEGKGEDIAKALLAKTFPNDTELQQKLLALDQTPSKGDVSAIIKFYNETKDLNKLTTYFNLYTNLKSKKIPMKKAPASFETFIKFTEYVDAAKPKPKLKGSPIAPTIEHEDSADKLVDTDELTIYKGDAQHKCVEYGKDYSFCISRRGGGNMYDSYRLQKESTFYFIFFKKIPMTNPDHILVLDHKKDGWEWTNQLNNTKETTWKEVVAKFPILTQYEDLFVKTPLADKEKANIQFLRDFKQEPSLKKFRAADRDLQLLVLKTGQTITDEIFTYLTNENLWDYINEYVSVGPNLTPLQADAIEAKGGAILKQYLKIRELAIPQLEQQNLLKINKLDKNISYIHRKIEADYKKAWDMVAAGKYSLSNLRFLDRLPDNIPENITEDFNCSNNNQLTSLEGAPKSVEGDFNCSNNNQLTSLEGAPKSVEGDFYCNSNQLTSLKGAPESVGGDFNCYHNNLTSLEGAPESVGGDFYCVANQLTSLEGAPESVGGDFICSNNQLTSLEGAPKSVGRDFHCADNQLTSLEGAPESVGGGFYCNGNQLTSLKGAPESVGRDFRCFNNWLTSLEGAPKSVGKDFICSDNQLTSLEGAPESVGGGFYCNDNQLTSLEGAPKSVRGTFNCDINQLTSLEGAPESVGGNFYCDNNPVEFTDEDIKSAMAESKRKLKGNTISKESFNSIVREILNEGKVEDIAKALLAKTFPNDTELQQKLLALDQTPSKGDVPNIIKLYISSKMPFDDFKLQIDTFYKFKQKGKIFILKPNYIDFTNDIEAIETKQKFKNAPVAPTIEHEDSADKLVDTDELTIYKGDAQHKCVEYGKEYSFCISRRIGGNMYDSYRLQNESTFYFIFFKKIPKTNPDHILVLDHKKNGWEWTNQLNNTKETTWVEVVAKFPVLAQYEDLFVNNPLSNKEKANILFVGDFKRNPSLEKFLAADRGLQLMVLKTGQTITDEIFTYLTNENLWAHINEYVSVGPNLTPLQADAIEAKGGAILKQYLKTREIAIPQLEQHNLFKINKLDKNISYIQQKIEKDYKKAWDMVAAGKYMLTGLMYLDRLPDNIPMNIAEDFRCYDNNNLTSLKGAPKSVGRDVYCHNNQLTSLEGAPESVGRDFYCHRNQLTSLKGAPKSVGGDFNCYQNPLTSLEGAPESVGKDFYCVTNKLTSLEGMPAYIGGTITISNNKVEFTEGDIKAAMEESKRKLEGNTISKESFNSIVREILNEGKKKTVVTDQFNEGVKAVLATVLGIGALGAGYMAGANNLQSKLASSPASNREKITALKIAIGKGEEGENKIKLIKAPQFHQAANTVIADLEAKEQRKEKREDNAAKKAADIPIKAKGTTGDPVIKKASDFILPSEILGKNIYNKVNDKFMKPYLDDVGKWTIGVGHLIGKGSLKDKQEYEKERKSAGLTPTLSRKEALELFMKDVSTRVPAVQAKFKKQWPLISDNLKAALIDIKFRGDLDNTSGGDFTWVKLIRAGEYKKAARAYLDHKEYKSRMLKKGTKGDGVVSRMNRNAKIIASEIKGKSSLSKSKA